MCVCAQGARVCVCVYTMSFHCIQIAQILRERTQAEHQAEHQADSATDSAADASQTSAVAVTPPSQREDTCDGSYVLFLEPPAKPPQDLDTLDACIDTAIRIFQPEPALSHCELLIPPVPKNEDLRTQFATYINEKSAWKTNKADNYNYYLKSNMGMWRAVPVFGSDIATRLRRECECELGVSYSLARYVTSARPLRAFAWMLPDSRRSPAHCATLTARVLRKTVPNTLQHSSAWYAPTTLYLEVCDATREKASRLLGATSRYTPKHTLEAIDSLLRGQMTSSNINQIGDDACLDATRALTLRVCSDLISGDTASQKISQKQLASALLRWVILRKN